MVKIANADGLNNKNIEEIDLEHIPLKMIFRLTDGRIIFIEEENDKNGNFCLVFKALKLEDGKPGDIVGRCLVGRTKWKEVKNLDILPRNVVRIPL